jgi:hypothetical protein
MPCKIWGFHGAVYEECRLLGCYTCTSYKNQRFGGTYLLHHQGYKNRRARNIIVFLRIDLRLLVTSILLISLILVTLMMEVIHYSETSVLTKATRHNISEDSTLHFVSYSFSLLPLPPFLFYFHSPLFLFTFSCSPHPPPLRQCHGPELNAWKNKSDVLWLGITNEREELLSFLQPQWHGVFVIQGSNRRSM